MQTFLNLSMLYSKQEISALSEVDKMFSKSVVDGKSWNHISCKVLQTQQNSNNPRDQFRYSIVEWLVLNSPFCLQTHQPIASNLDATITSSISQLNTAVWEVAQGLVAEAESNPNEPEIEQCESKVFDEEGGTRDKHDSVPQDGLQSVAAVTMDASVTDTSSCAMAVDVQQTATEEIVVPEVANNDIQVMTSSADEKTGELTAANPVTYLYEDQKLTTIETEQVISVIDTPTSIGKSTALKPHLPAHHIRANCTGSDTTVNSNLPPDEQCNQFGVIMGCESKGTKRIRKAVPRYPVSSSKVVVVSSDSSNSGDSENESERASTASSENESKTSDDESVEPTTKRSKTYLCVKTEDTDAIGANTNNRSSRMCFDTCKVDDCCVLRLRDLWGRKMNKCTKAQQEFTANYCFDITITQKSQSDVVLHVKGWDILLKINQWQFNIGASISTQKTVMTKEYVSELKKNDHKLWSEYTKLIRTSPLYKSCPQQKST